jgi:predicted transglutaminase-like cysteine proteinase
VRAQRPTPLKLRAGATRTGRYCVLRQAPVPIVPSAAAARAAHALRRALVAVLVPALLGTLSVGRVWEADRLQQVAQRAGPRAAASARALQAVLAGSAELDEDARLLAVNQFFNRRIVFSDDELVWGVTDHWASPVELLEKGRGDCEDFAIAKYFSLLAAGVPAARLRLVYVRALVGGPGGVQTPHMVLAHYTQPGAEPTILDNLIDDLRPASRRPDLTPVFSFNGEGLWGAAGTPAGDPTARLSRWREVLAKARAEGFP